MKLPKIIQKNGTRFLTSRQLTEWYQVEEWQIKQNFRNNKKRFVLGKHYITLQGEELKRFKSEVENIYLVGKTAKIIYLWTEKGALLHAKSLNTDKAWEAYDYLVDFYFRAKEATELPKKENSIVPDVSELSEDDIRRIGINRGIVMGVYRAENEQLGFDTIEIYNRLSVRGQLLVQSLIFGEVPHV